MAANARRLSWAISPAARGGRPLSRKGAVAVRRHPAQVVADQRPDGPLCVVARGQRGEQTLLVVPRTATNSAAAISLSPKWW